MSRKHGENFRKWPFLAVNGWREFQHYRERRPPWIKLHASILENHAFARLTDRDKGTLPYIWLLASRHDNKIPNDPEWIRDRIGWKRVPNLSRFVQDGFLIEWKPENEAAEKTGITFGNASTAIALREQSASSETETEDRGREQSQKRPAARVAPRPTPKGSPTEGAAEKPPKEGADSKASSNGNGFPEGAYWPIKGDPWKRALPELRARVEKRHFETWLQPLRFRYILGQRVVLSAPTAEFAAFIREQFSSQLSEVMKQVEPELSAISWIVNS
jgi:DnaA N-terminal domain